MEETRQEMSCSCEQPGTGPDLDDSVSTREAYCSQHLLIPRGTHVFYNKIKTCNSKCCISDSRITQVWSPANATPVPFLSSHLQCLIPVFLVY